MTLACSTPPSGYVPGMPQQPIWKRVLEGIMSIGASPDESESRRSGRRVFILAFILAGVFSIPPAIARFDAGYTWVGVVDLVTLAIPVLLLVVIAIRPTSYVATLHVMFVVIVAGPVLDTAMFGGLLPSGLLVIFGLDVALAALLAISLGAGLVWFGVFLLSVVYAVAIPHWVDPIYTLNDPTGNAAFNLIATGIVTIAVMIYFIRQRDRFQQRSDDLLHAILPDRIVAQLKDAPGTIADDVASASVLFADVVDFTPLSATMTPADLVDLLDGVFSAFDGFVQELGLEKIKTVGDAYMVASGVPVPRDDHADAIADLALRIRDLVATTTFGGRRLQLRIGVASGPVTAGIIGTQKFAYDLWGDTVNTASRMESSGLPGEIQLAPTTYELLRDRYRCQPRGPVQVKGKSEMITFLLLERRQDASW
jgi:adenylate cyclase